MNFQWPDPISMIADIVTFIGIPVLAFTTRQLLKEARRRRYLNAVGQDCINFGRADNRSGINCVSLTEITAVPRPGDTVLLQGNTEMGKNYTILWIMLK